MTMTDEKRKMDLLATLKHCMDDLCGSCKKSGAGRHIACMDFVEDSVTVPRRLLEEIVKLLEVETVWEYWPDEEGKPRWRCRHCGKIVHKDPADKLHCSVCGLRARKEA